MHSGLFCLESNNYSTFHDENANSWQVGRKRKFLDAYDSPSDKNLLPWLLLASWCTVQQGTKNIASSPNQFIHFFSDALCYDSQSLFSAEWISNLSHPHSLHESCNECSHECTACDCVCCDCVSLLTKLCLLLTNEQWQLQVNIKCIAVEVLTAS